MGSKKGGVEVYDYLLSTHYGLCHGPVDQINQVWIKDKPVWCGNGGGRIDVSIVQPEIFGGDDAEGGVVGVMEVYDGRHDQFASAALAGRVGRTPATMPGYRGLASMFFRGGNTKQGNNWTQILESLFNIFDPDRVPSLVQINPPMADNGAGFRWGTNNPYFPELKASATRLSRTLGTAYSVIWPIKSVASDGTFVSAETDALVLDTDDLITTTGSIDTTMGNHFLSIEELGMSALQVDSALTALSFRWKYTPVGFPGSANVAVALFCHQANPDGTRSEQTINVLPGSSPFYVNAVNNTNLIELTWYLPPGTRYVNIQASMTTSGGGTLSEDIRTWSLLTPSLSSAHCRADGSIGWLPNANPAHMIYECMTDQDWGKADDPALIDVASFQAAAITLKNEFFGLSIKWIRSGEIGAFIQEILDHIQAVLFQDPESGLWTLKLLRADYDPATAPILDPSNCRLSNRKRRLWGEITNEIVLTYTNPETEEEATVTSHDLASIAIQGGIKSDTRNYYGIRDPHLAKIVADRDVRAASYPLFSAEAEVDRTMWRIKPGSVVRLNWPQDGIANMLMRVMDVDYGSPKDRTIKLGLTEDIFAVDQSEFSAIQPSLWVSDRRDPSALDAESAVTAPLPMMLRNGATLTDVDAAYPAAAVVLMGDEDGYNPLDIEVHTTKTDPTGSASVEPVLTMQPARSWVTPAVLVPEAGSRLPSALIDAISLGDASAGDLYMLGTLESVSELVMLDTFDTATDEWVVARGIWDTIPLTWAIGTRLWEFPVGRSRLDPAERAAGETVTYRLLPRTTMGQLPYGGAADLTLTVTNRPHAPFRPAKCELNGAGFGGFEHRDGGVAPPPVIATWANRDRAAEDSIYRRWTDATVTPEVGQTTSLLILNAAGVMQSEITGLTGTSHEIPFVDLQVVGVGFVEFRSVRDGLTSITGARRAFDVRASGYGYGYGNTYGTIA